jgi:hypothetical protein
MATDLLLDQETNDLVINEFGDLVLVTGPDQALQAIAYQLRTQLGEWFLDETVGVDYQGLVLVKNPDLGVIRTEFLRALLYVPEVLRVRRLELEQTGRTLVVSFEAIVEAGAVVTGAVASDGTIESIVLLLHFNRNLRGLPQDMWGY